MQRVDVGFTWMETRIFLRIRHVFVEVRADAGGAGFYAMNGASRAR